MDTLIFLKEKPGIIYANVLKKLYDGNIDKLFKDPNVFHEYWMQSMDIIQPEIKEYIDKFSYPGHHCGFWGVLFEVMFRDLLVPIEILEPFCREIFSEFIRPQYWEVENTFDEFYEKSQERGIRLSIISNWDERLPLLLKYLNIDNRFDRIITSHEAGYEKPSERIFNYYLRQLKNEEHSKYNQSNEEDLKERVLHIGDKFKEDYSGAIDFGFKALHYAPSNATQSWQIQTLLHSLQIEKK